MILDYEIKKLSQDIESIKKIKSLEGRISFYKFADSYITEYLKEALEHLIMKRNIQEITVETKEKLDEIHKDGKQHDRVYKEMEDNFLSVEQGLIEELLEYAPKELVEYVQEFFYRHRKFAELYALEKATDRLARKVNSVITASAFQKKDDDNLFELSKESRKGE